MWFVELLLLYSLGYAAWRQFGVRYPEREGCAPPLGQTLVTLAVGISVTTVLVRLVFPLLRAQIAHLQLWQWPQDMAMFGLGIVAAQRRWLDPVPDRIRRRCGLAALLGVLGVLAVAGTVLATGNEPDAVIELAKVGREAAGLLVRRLEGDDDKTTRCVTVETALVVRESSGVTAPTT
jgi:hypothetical protein